MDSRITFPLAALVLGLLTAGAHAELKPESTSTAKLPATQGKHWVWVNDLVFPAMESGRAMLVDGDSGQMLGMLSTGYFFQSIVLPSDYSAIYSPEIYLTRGTRGKREDVVAYYDTQTLTPTTEIDVPPKKVSAVGLAGHANLTTDDRFLAAYNFTPAQSVTMVDIRNKKFIEEVETPGCAQVYTAGKRAFNMVCGDGTMLTLKLDDTGKVTKTERSAAFFDPRADMLDDKPVRFGDTWLFVTMNNIVKPVDMSSGNPKFGEEWSLLDGTEPGWRAGGFQYLAVNEPANELYVLVHEGGKWTHKNPGKHVWVYDLATKKRTRTIALEEEATSISVSPDAEPLLYTAYAEHGGLHVYDAKTGTHKHHVSEVGISPIVLLPVPPGQ